MRILLLATLCALPGCGGGCTDPTPSSQTCEPGAARGEVTSVDLGRRIGDAFTAYQDDDIVPLVVGGQGSPMLVFNLRLRGSDLPGCMPQVTRAYRDGEYVGSEIFALVTDQVLPDTWITGEMLVVVYDAYAGDYITVETEAGGITAVTGLWIDYVGTFPDAAVPVDAAPVDAAVVVDAPPPDAAP